MYIIFNHLPTALNNIYFNINIEIKPVYGEHVKYFSFNLS